MLGVWIERYCMLLVFLYWKQSMNSYIQIQCVSNVCCWLALAGLRLLTTRDSHSSLEASGIEDAEEVELVKLLPVMQSQMVTLGCTALK